jgi:hypothetical protein
MFMTDPQFIREGEKTRLNCCSTEQKIVFAGNRAALFERTDASLVDAKADSVREAIGGNEAGKKSLEWNCSDEGITTKPACAG